LALVAVALVLLAVAASRDGGQPPGDLAGASPAAGRMATQPAPESDVPAIVSVAVTTSVTVRAPLVRDSRSHLPHAPGRFTLAPHLPPAPPGTDRPRSFPLLI
jgi:hypothetical protein